MQIRTVKLHDLKPAAYNPRKALAPEDAEYQKLNNSILEFGYVEPIIWNERTGNIVGGHQRATVMRDNGYTEVEAVVINVSEHDERILNVLLNRASGRWDIQKLQTLMQELEDAGADIALTGFDDYELQGLVDAYNNMDDILDFEPDTGDDEDTDDEEPEDDEPALFDMDFQIPIEDKPAVEAYLEAFPDALVELATAVINLVKGVSDHAD